MSIERRNSIIDILKKSKVAISASALAKEFDVSRQVIVGDIALLRAAGENISATPRGYVHDRKTESANFGFVGIIASMHTFAQLREELYAVVDYGGTLIDVTIEHSLYGQISGPLDISSRYDADLFIRKVEGENDKPLYSLTGGIHLHRIGCKDQKSFSMIEKSLRDKNILFESSPLSTGRTASDDCL